MSHYILNLTLLSDATFGTGSGVAGLLDREVEHDANGFPFLRGRTLKGLLREEADNILFALEQISVPDLAAWEAAHQTLFGRSGSGLEAAGQVHYGHAQLPMVVRQALLEEGFNKEQILGALTAVRRQTALESDPEIVTYGTPVQGSLRAMRVVLRQTILEAQLTLQKESLTNKEEALLVAAVQAWRRAGTGRNRGRGRLQATLCDSDRKPVLLSLFKQEAKLI